MNRPDRTDVRQVNVKVNGITFGSVWLRRSSGANDFDIVIDDPQIGRFALTPAFPDLELRDEDSDWRQVTLDELKKILADEGELADTAEERQAFEVAERESFNRLVAEGEHIMNAEIALFRAGIPFLQRPFRVEHRKPGRIAIASFDNHVLSKDSLKGKTQPQSRPARRRI